MAKATRSRVTGKELVPVAVALAAVSVSVMVPKMIKMARNFRKRRQEKGRVKAAAKKLTLSKAMAAAREAKNRLTAAPKLPSYIPHQADKKAGASARQKALLKTTAARAKSIRNNDYTRSDHAVNRG